MTTATAKRAHQPAWGRTRLGLVVGAGGDRLDHEAAAVAVHMARMPDPGAALTHRSREAARTVGRVAADPDQEARLQALADVRIHRDRQAAEAAEHLEAGAFTVGSDVYFARDGYRPHTPAGRRLLAHELVHVLQQRTASAHRVQRRIREDVTTWTATKLGPPVPVNGADRRMITIPPTGQILITADVDVHGDAGDACPTLEVGTTQTAWMASTVMIYRGRTNAEGSVVVRHNAAIPQRDPGPAGAVWYDPANVRRPAACGASVQIRHVDSPWHSPPKARNNTAVAGSPLNYLTWYRRGLNLVTYLTTRDGAGTFRRQPLRFRYWATIQEFTFSPQYPAPPGNAAFLGMWPFTGGIRVVTGASGRGETADAPYFTTATGTDYNTHFNTAANWTITERPTW